MVSASKITKSFGSLRVLNGVDIHVKKGEVVSIVGPSGAGKTTLLQILGTLEKPDSGILTINKTEVSSLRKSDLTSFRNREIGFVFQFHHLLPEFTALENICIPAYIGGLGRAEAERKAADLLKRLGLSERASHKPNALSGGEQQRVAVARALINEPSVVFADEPSGNLDSKNADELHQLFFDLREEFGQTFIIVTHNKDLAGMADRTLTMVDGKFAAPVSL